MVLLGTCTRKNLCVDCDSELCYGAGKKASDCPKYTCPTPGLDCETECRWIDRYIEKMRGMKNEN